MHKIISKTKEEIIVIKKFKNNQHSKSSFKKKLNEPIQEKAYHFKALFTLQKIVLFNYIFINLFINVISKNKTEDNNNIRKLSFTNEIKIKILGKGNQNVLNSEFVSKCTEITINGNPGVLKENNIVYVSESEEENTIVMKWDYKLNSSSSMFMELTNLIEIDLSNFDASELLTMHSMFSSCKNLKNVIIGKNFDSSKAKHMTNMFRFCESLISLDLSNLNTKSADSMSFMFESCFSLEYLNLENFDTSSVTMMSSMFGNCYSLISLNLSNFNTSFVEGMNEMFINCISLKTLDISSFDISNVVLIHKMFFNCSSLTSLDLQNFKKTNAMTLVGLFYGCKEIKYINLSNLDGFYSRSMDSMFSECNKLVSVDISNLNTNHSLFLSFLFKGCVNIEYINMSNLIEGSNVNASNAFDDVPDNIVYCINDEAAVPNIMSELRKKKYAVNDCSKKWKSNKKKLIEENGIYVEECFYNNTYYYEYKYICYRSCPNGTKILNVNDYLCIIDCPAELPFQENEECIDKCKALDFFNEICTINNDNIKAKENIIKTIIDEINTLNINEEEKDLTIKSKNITYQITSSFNQLNGEYNDITSINIGECENILKKKYNIKNDKNLVIFKVDYFIDGFLIPITEYDIFNPENYTKLDLNQCKEVTINISIPVSINEEELYKYDPYSEYYIDKCFPNILECQTNNNLSERKNEFNNKYLSLCEKNCYFSGYNSINKNVLCQCKFKTEFSLLSDLLYKKDELLYNFNISNLESDKNVISDDIENCDAEKFFENKCIFNEFESEIKQKIISMIINQIKEGNLNDIINNTIIKNKEDLIEKENDVIYQLTSSENQKNNEYINISTLNLNECENILKKYYNISENDSLIIFKLDNIISDINIPIVEYQVYDPITKNTLSLDICNDTTINIKYPVNINKDEIFKYDPNSDFYNDNCFPYTSDRGTDIILEDRKKEYNDKNLALCEKECDFIGYDKNNKKVSCKCKPKEVLSKTTNINFDKYLLLHKFIDFKDNTNIYLIFCFHRFFSLDGIKYNIGSYILIIIIIINIIGIILFYKKGFLEINEIIKNIIKNKVFNNKNKISQISHNTKKHNKTTKKNKSKKIDKIYKVKKQKNLINKSNPNKKKTSKNINDSENSTNINNKDSFKSFLRVSQHIYESPKEKKLKKKTNFKNNKHDSIFTKFTDYEINTLKYEEALKYDKRTYLQYYVSLLRIKHILIFTFITNNDYNSKIIKICLFFFFFALTYSVNSLFYQDPKIHQFYNDNGTYKFIYQIPQICYSTIISAIITFFIKYMSLSENYIISLKHSENLDNYSKIRKCLFIKFLLFFILIIILLLSFWYYLGCFCAVFKNSQIYLIKDTFYSFLLSLLYPFGLQLLPGIFRIPSLKVQNKGRKCMYVFSKIIQIF